MGELGACYKKAFDRIQSVETLADLEAIQANLENDIAKSMESPCEGFNSACQLLDDLNPEVLFPYLEESKYFSRVTIRDNVMDLMSCIGHKREELSPNHQSASPEQDFTQTCKASYETSKQIFLDELGVCHKKAFDRIQNVKNLAELEAIEANLANDIAKFMKSPCEGFNSACQLLDALNPEAPSPYLEGSKYFSRVMIRDNVMDLISCIGHQREHIARLQTHNQGTSSQGLFRSESTGGESQEYGDNKQNFKPNWP